MGLSTFNGIPVLVSPYAEKKHRKQIRFPRSKRRRIQKKWSKRDENFKIWSEPLAFLANGTLICHPVILDQFRKEVYREAERTFSGYSVCMA